MQSKLFYRIYDTLFSAKDYAGEVSTLITIAKSRYPLPIKNILEIGCGTGNHTLELASTKNNILAIDIDPEMTAITREKTKKLKNVSVKTSSVEYIKEKKKFELVLAAFNVVTYLPDTKALISFFKGVSQSLKKDGVLIFDCWNGISAIQDPPRNKVYSTRFGNRTIQVEIISLTDLFRQKTTLKYSFNGKNSFTFDQTLWTPNQLSYALEANGLIVLECCKNFKPGTRADVTDWKMMFICKKA